jgi:tetratricopeptide (TPR) repeat protein
VASRQGRQELIVVVLVCAATGLMQVGIGLASRHGTLPRALRITPARARALLAVAVVLALVVAIAAGAPTRISHAWRDFKKPSAPSLHQDTLARFGSTSGNQRYDYWKVSAHQSSGHLLTGWGPGTWQFVWLAHAPYAGGYVRDAHSLYFETLVEDGAIGLGLLLAFLVAVPAAAVRVVIRSRERGRVLAAGVAGACVAFVVSAAFDWVWQVPVLPVGFMLLAGAILAPARVPKPDERAAGVPASGRRAPGRAAGLILRGGVLAGSLVCLAVIAIALATTSALRASQADAAAGDTSAALSKALTAERLDPAAGDPKLQLALVYELRHDLPAAVAAARAATAADRLNWGTWLVRSRLEAESGHPAEAVQAFIRARSLNPHSAVFAR